MSGPSSATTSPTAARRPRRVWFDPRFAIGLALVVLSVLGVVGLVSSAGASVDVLTARTTLTPGEHVTAADLVPTSLRAGGIPKLYLQQKDVPSVGVIVTRAIAAGELVPASAVGSQAGAGLTSVVVSVGSALAASIGPGDRVDLWSAEQLDTATAGSGGSFAAPTVLVSSAIVVRIIDQKNLVTTGTGSSVELLVPRASTASVLDAIENAAALSVVPVDVPLEQ